MSNMYEGKHWVDDWNDDSFGNLIQHYYSPITEKHYALICTENRKKFIEELRKLADYYDIPTEEKLGNGGSPFISGIWID